MTRYWTVWSSALLFFAAFYALLVPIPLYLEAAGLPDWQIGLVLGAFGIASLVGRPLTGALCDSLGSRPVILFGTAALAVGAAAMSFTANPVLLFGCAYCRRQDMSPLRRLPLRSSPTWRNRVAEEQLLPFSAPRPMSPSR
ncbi:MAG: MFS transporter [Caldilineaceae bacterium]|nr:MFS transporter [Caldilineaceae bacterium]